jgi:hypothetical protein
MSEIALPYLYFALFKFVGYSVFTLALLRKAYPASKSNFLIVGLIRTAAGVLIGTLYWYSLSLIQWDSGPAHSILYLGLIPIRFAEWWFIIWLFYDRSFSLPKIGWRNVIFGTAASYVLDVPSFFGDLKLSNFHYIC